MLESILYCISLIIVTATLKLRQVSDNSSSANGNSSNTRSTGSKMKDTRPRYSENTFLQLFFLTQLTGTLMIAVLLIWILNYVGNFGWTNHAERFSWHPLLLILGLIYFGGNSMLAFRVLKKQPKNLVKYVHSTLHIIAFTCALIGALAVFTSHWESNPPKPNLYSLHSWIGFAATSLFFIQYVSGFYCYLFPIASGQLRSWLLPYHIIGGFGIFILSVMAALTGFAEKMGFKSKPYMEYTGAMWTMNLTGVFMIAFTFLVLYLGTERSYKRSAIPEQIPLTGRNDESPLQSPN